METEVRTPATARPIPRDPPVTTAPRPTRLIVERMERRPDLQGDFGCRGPGQSVLAVRTPGGASVIELDAAELRFRQGLSGRCAPPPLARRRLCFLVGQGSVEGVLLSRMPATTPPLSPLDQIENGRGSEPRCAEELRRIQLPSLSCNYHRVV